jgi:hypothetical protein
MNEKPTHGRLQLRLRGLLPLMVALIICLPTACGVAEPPTPSAIPAVRSIDTFAFIDGYRISRYLEVAVELQKIEPAARAARLRELARDPDRASEVYPLCRMLFQEKKRHEFRRPEIGAASFVGRTAYHDWPLEPITIYQGVPIVIVRGYKLGGEPEPPESYVEYCLSNCGWSGRRYASADKTRLREIVSQFLAANPKFAADADWIRPQAE